MKPLCIKNFIIILCTNTNFLDLPSNFMLMLCINFTPNHLCLNAFKKKLFLYPQIEKRCEMTYEKMKAEEWKDKSSSDIMQVRNYDFGAFIWL